MSIFKQDTPCPKQRVKDSSDCTWGVVSPPSRHFLGAFGFRWSTWAQLILHTLNHKHTKTYDIVTHAHIFTHTANVHPCNLYALKKPWDILFTTPNLTSLCKEFLSWIHISVARLGGLFAEQNGERVGSLWTQPGTWQFFVHLAIYWQLFRSRAPWLWQEDVVQPMPHALEEGYQMGWLDAFVLFHQWSFLWLWSSQVISMISMLRNICVIAWYTVYCESNVVWNWLQILLNLNWTEEWFHRLPIPHLLQRYLFQSGAMRRFAGWNRGFGCCTSISQWRWWPSKSGGLGVDTICHSGGQVRFGCRSWVISTDSSRGSLGSRQNRLGSWEAEL